MNNIPTKSELQLWLEKWENKLPEDCVKEFCTSIHNKQIHFKCTEQEGRSMKKPKVFCQYAGSPLDVAEIYMAASPTLNTAYQLFQELHSNRDSQNNISYLNKHSLDLNHLARNLKPWLNKNIIHPIDTRQIKESISLLCLSRGIPQIAWGKNRKYYMFNPQILIPFIKKDSAGVVYDFWVFIYQYIQYKKTVKQTQKLGLEAKYMKNFIDSLGDRFRELTENMSEFSKQFWVYVEEQEESHNA